MKDWQRKMEDDLVRQKQQPQQDGGSGEEATKAAPLSVKDAWKKELGL